MKLTGMAEAYQEQQQQPAAAELDFDERLGLSGGSPVDVAGGSRVENSASQRQAEIGSLFRGPGLLLFRRGLKRSQTEQLASSEWIRYHQNCIVTGPTGTGKTFLACALGQKACRDGYRVRYYVAGKLFRELSAAHGDGSFLRLSMKLLRADLLLVDDWGMETLQERQYRDFLEILDDRQGSGSTLVTSQYPTSSGTTRSGTRPWRTPSWTG